MEQPSLTLQGSSVRIEAIWLLSPWFQHTLAQFYSYLKNLYILHKIYNKPQFFLHYIFPMYMQRQNVGSTGITKAFPVLHKITRRFVCIAMLLIFVFVAMVSTRNKSIFMC